MVLNNQLMKKASVWGKGLMILMALYSYQAVAMEEKESERKVVRILTIDGGGVRGIIPATVLEGIEERLQGNLGKGVEPIRLADYFDIMAGTSTGGLIVLGLNAGKTARDMANLYLNEGEKIFPPAGFWKNVKSYKGPKFEAGPLEEVLEDQLGETWLSESISHVLIPSYDLGQTISYVFDSKQAKLASQNYKMKDVARATSAAPTFFRAAKISNERGDKATFIDGGVDANDPTFEAIHLAEKNYPNADLFILSLGTGETPKKFGELSFLEDAGKIKWAQEITDTLMKNQQDRHLRVVRHIQDTTKKQQRKFEYHRIQVPISEEIAAMDNSEVIPNLRQAGLFLLNSQNPSGIAEVITKEIVTNLESNPEVKKKQDHEQLL